MTDPLQPSVEQSAHYPEPWSVRALELHQGGTGLEMVDADGDVISDNQTYYPKELEAGNARRIVACINYCAGTPTRVLEQGRLPGGMEHA
jgi:hypothetical protein